MNEEVERLGSEVAELRTALERSRSQVEFAIRKVQELELAQRMAAMPDSEDAGMVTPRVMVSHIPQLCGEDPKPFYVEWSDDDDQWIIYVPAGSIVSDNDYETLLLDTLTPATKYDGDWYVLDGIQAGSAWTSVYLNCWTVGSGSGSSSSSAVITTSPEEHSDASEEYIVKIANVKSLDVRQFTVGVLVLKSGSSGESPTPASTVPPRHFDINKTVTPQGTVYKVVNCQIMCGNQECTCGDYTVNNNGGNIYLHVSRQTSGGYSISVDQNFVAETATSISVMLWEFSLAPVLDVRPGYIPVFAV